ncbi:uncharacterized protein LOC111636306 [Centruroides sculpturatus]|uniref:uncharacterized protein LOC111636306 n=1 Tax=Centruroides sculpturatus TaxID=218467 RepID=UPI000C6DE6ED|nr:uncharacterized protein LOC111636306 [Centruroides sculpturatus]
MLSKTRKDRTRNEEIRDRTGMKNMKKIEQISMRWFGHTKGIEDNRIPKLVLEKDMEERKPRRRPCNRWMDKIAEDLRKRTMVFVEEWWKDRKRWRPLVHCPSQASWIKNEEEEVVCFSVGKSVTQIIYPI